jgi:hypothetical protein
VTNSTARTFDDRNTKWYPLGDIERIVFSMLNLDLKARVVDFIAKFDANEWFVLHRHLPHTNTYAIQGDHRLYDPSSNLSDVRPLGTYTSSPPGGPHCEGSGDSQWVVIYDIRGKWTDSCSK